MADQVGWSTLSKIVLWTSVAFVILYIVMSGIYWRQYVAAKTVDPNGEIVSLWASFPLFTFLWSFVILGFVLFLLWRAHTTDVIFTAAAGVGTFLSQGYAKRFGPDKEMYKQVNTIKELARRIELARAASEKAIKDDTIVKNRSENEVKKASDELELARQKYEQEENSLSKNDDEVISAKQRYESTSSANEKAKIAQELADLTAKEARITRSMQKAENNVNMTGNKLKIVKNAQKIIREASDTKVRQTSERLNELNKEFEKFFVGDSKSQLMNVPVVNYP